MYKCTTGMVQSNAFGCIMADEMGLGKTVSSHSISNFMKRLRTRFSSTFLSLLFDPTIASMSDASLDTAETITRARQRNNRKVHHLLPIVPCPQLGQRDYQVAGSWQDRSADL